MWKKYKMGQHQHLHTVTDNYLHVVWTYPTIQGSKDPAVFMSLFNKHINQTEEKWSN